MVLVSAFVVGQAAPEGVPDVIRAKTFEVVNEVGSSVVALRSWEHGGRIETRNHQGKGLFTVAANDAGGGSLTTFNAEGKKLVTLGVVKAEGVMDGTGMVGVYDPTGRTRRGILTTRP